ncbi:FtsQ-type POTRA domain-containing protein [Guyparkeria halophila]|uniref:Cell division protein FtsQ n=1 Tax=Guyparkeria halophila TaxID=47960 RepID=A0A6I6D4H2_9GAMM|nr:cell division protein FtsQ/DivIB [Guyparkeria halophila]QGT79045.1 FtsQ-type POTRA domain-containing protein [Guyparkeria halophila]
MVTRRASRVRPRGPSWHERWTAFVTGLRVALRWAWRIGLWLAFVAAVALVSQRVWLKLQSPVAGLVVEGENRFVTAERVQQELWPALGQGIWSVDIAAMRERLLADGWLTEVRITRQWPDRLLVSLETHQPIAAWNGDQLLSASGAVFAPERRPVDLSLPRLAGPTGSQWTVWERYTSLKPVLATVGLELSGVTMSPRGSLSLALASGAVIHTGQESLEARLQRLLDVYPDTLAGKMDRVERIDLRYSNGFAVAWRETDSETTDKTTNDED